MKKQRGQAIVEFALVLPMFMLLLFGVVISGLMFADYMTLSNVARSSAREAALSGESKYGDIKTNYRDDTHLLSNLYTWPEDGMTIDYVESLNKNESGDAVKVTITANLNQNFPGVGLLKNKYFKLGFPPDTYTIEYSMRSEATREAEQ